MSNDHQVIVHLTDEELQRIDALLPRCATATCQPTRADVLRALEVLGVDAIERDGGSSPPEKGGAR